MSLSPKDYHPDLFDLHLIWGRFSPMEQPPYGFSEKVLIPDSKREELCALHNPTIGKIREVLIEPDDFTVKVSEGNNFGFDEENFNRFVQLTYSYDETFHDSPIAWNYLHINTLTDYLELLAEHCTDKYLEVVEIGCGFCSERWAEVIRLYKGKKKLHLTLLDFNQEIACIEAEKLKKAIRPGKAVIDCDQYDCLKNEIDAVPMARVIIGFYLLDSLNFSGDYIERTDFDYFPGGYSTMIRGRQLYRIRVSPYVIGESRAKELASSITHSFKKSELFPLLSRSELEAVTLERIINTEKVGLPLVGTQCGWEVISEGTIAYLKQLQTRLSPGGKIIFGDTFTNCGELRLIESIGQRGIVSYKRPEIERIEEKLQNTRFINAGVFAKELRMEKNKSILFRLFGRPYQPIIHAERFMEISAPTSTVSGM